MAWTSHGRHIPGTDLENMPSRVARCGGILTCQQCREEADAAGTFGVSPKPVRDETDKETLNVVYACLARAGVDPRKAHLAITDMQARGILFRERNRNND